MKRFSLQCAVLAMLLGAMGLVSYVNGDGKTANRAARPQLTMRVALVDTAHILKNYTKYEDLQHEVREAAENAQAKAKGMIDQARTLQEQLQSGDVEDGSEEFLKKERQIISLSSKLEVYNALAKKDLKKKDAETLAAVYHDVQDALAVYAEQNGYTMILRFTREFEGLDEKQRTAQLLNQTIIHHEGADDITDGVLAWLNQQYQSAGKNTENKAPATTPRKAAPATTSTTTPATKAAPPKATTARKPQTPASAKTLR